MNALINLEECREHMTVTIGGKNHQVDLSGTVIDPYFCGRNVCDILGCKDPKDALQRYVEKEDKINLSDLIMKNMEEETIRLGGEYLPPHAKVKNNLLGKNKNLTFREGQTIYISEVGLYSLILSSQAPFAKEFKKLVCKTILPSIRKYGSYQVDSQLADAMTQLAIKDKSHEEETKELQNRLKQEKQRAEKAEKEAEDHKQYSLILKELTFNNQKRPLNEAIYISTSKAYAN